MSNETKQTAVEWLILELQKRDMDVLISDLYIQAKEMEKEQIAEAFTKGNQLDVYDGTETSGEKYYNETYGGNK
jgi:hypothetical protein